MLHEDDRIVVPDGGGETPLHVIRVGRRDDLQPRNVHKHRVKALGVLGSLAPAFPNHAPDHQRRLNRAPVHEAQLGGHVDQLIHAKKKKIHADVDVNGPQPGKGRADGHAGHPLFR